MGESTDTLPPGSKGPLSSRYLRGFHLAIYSLLFIFEDKERIIIKEPFTDLRFFPLRATTATAHFSLPFLESRFPEG
jgi:hypothetical protein